MPFDLIIWDCDGCLIDSEVLSCGSAAAVVTAAGYFITMNQFMTRYMGWNWRDIYDDLERETKSSFREIMPYETVVEARNVLFENELKPIAFIHETLELLSGASCIASGSEPERVDKTLKLTGLYDYFKGRIFSASQVKKGKPAPDVFLFAAKQMGVKPENCLVIEDGIHGIVAAKAAGMTVFAFTGGSHMYPELVEKVKALDPALIFNDMRQLPELVSHYKFAL